MLQRLVEDVVRRRATIPQPQEGVTAKQGHKETLSQEANEAKHPGDTRLFLVED